MALKVYCERGAYKLELRDLERVGLIALVHFPYEGHNRRIPTWSTPSVVTADSTYITADSTICIGDMEASDKFSEIKAIIGAENEYDARHLDSAYKSQCACFLTPDKRDIAAKAVHLERLLGLRVFHVTEQWDEFLAYVHGAQH